MTAWITAIASVFAATIAALLAYRNNRVLHQRQEQLSRINAQLGEFYGPLFSISEAEEAAWEQFCEQSKRGGYHFFDGCELTTEERAIWKRWILMVFMPSNRRMYEIIVTKSHLLIGDHMPSAVADFCAHVACYEVILQQWEEDDYSQISSPVIFPKEFRPYIRESFSRLKAQQQRLLRLAQSSPRHS